MRKVNRSILLAIAGAVTLAVTPVHAVTISSGSAPSAAKSTAMTKKQMKQAAKAQARLQKQCAKLAAGKVKNPSSQLKASCAGAGPDASKPVTPSLPSTPSGSSQAPAGSSGGSNPARAPEDVPEPTTLALLGLGLAGLGFSRRRAAR